MLFFEQFMAGITEREGIKIGGQKDVNQIKGVAEQQFVLLLLKKNPRLVIFYEPYLFERKKENGGLEGTRPDFYIFNPNTKRGIFVEITAENRGNRDDLKEKDPKEKQKRVMNLVAPGERYMVLYRENLLKIQKANPDFSFFNGKKVRNEEEVKEDFS